MGGFALAASFFVALAPSAAQQAGTAVTEGGPPLAITECTAARGCTVRQGAATLEASRRWVHEAGGWRSCLTDAGWDAELCPDGAACARQCAVAAVSAAQYADTFGVTAVDAGLQLRLSAAKQPGSRVLLLAETGNYRSFRLPNREFALDIDASELPCGATASAYFAEIDWSGDLSSGNQAGARYGTGYCDARCPRDVTFIGGEANVEDWTNGRRRGSYGSCCAQMDIWEATAVAASFTPRPCSVTGHFRCSKAECDGGAAGVCDKDGCSFSSLGSGDANFYGPGRDFRVDTTLPFTVVTQFITNDGTDLGDLVEIRRFYWQAGQVVENSKASICVNGTDCKSITDGFCRAQRATFGGPDNFSGKGGLTSIGKALSRGMVLALSIQDSAQVDSLPPNGGSVRNCQGNRTAEPTLPAAVRFTNLAYGEIGSTLGLRRRLQRAKWV